MPKATQQKMPVTTPASAPNVSNGKPVSGGSILDRVRPVKQSIDSMLISLYGCSGSGKTRLGCTFPKPLLVVGSEDGTASVIGTKGVDFVRLERCEELTTISEVLPWKSRWKMANGWQQLEGHDGAPYASVVFDNGSKYRDMRIMEILGLTDVSVDALQKGFGFAGREQWVECANSLKALLNPFMWACKSKKVNCVIIAHEADLAKEGSQKDSDMIAPDIGLAMGKSVADWINAECDYVGQCMIRERRVEKEVAAPGGGKIKQSVGTGKPEWCLRVSPNGLYRAKFRIPLGVTLAQEFIVDPSYEKIVGLLQGKKV